MKATTSKGRSHATKDAMAAALVDILSEGTPLNKIPIRKITERCRLDRQTFYYHFKNIEELVEYSAEHEMLRVLGVDSLQEAEAIDWRTMAEYIFKEIESQPALRKSIIPALGSKHFNDRLIEVFRLNLEHEMVPRLTSSGMGKEQAQKSSLLISHAFASILMAWITYDIDQPADILLDQVSFMYNDYIAGATARMQEKTRAA